MIKLLHAVIRKNNSLIKSAFVIILKLTKAFDIDHFISIIFLGL